MPDLQAQFGQIDIYLFDQVLRGRITPGMRVLDEGCGSGRNLVLAPGGFLFARLASTIGMERRVRPTSMTRSRSSASSTTWA